MTTSQPLPTPQAPPPVSANPVLVQKIKDAIKSSVIRGDFEVPTLPNVTAEVMKLMNNPNVSLAQLENVIKQDPAITARVIKTANSVLYRAANEITSLQQAMARIGLRNVKDIVITLGIQSKTFNIANFEDLLGKIWKNSLATAVIAQSLAKISLADKEGAFLTGLLSNIGKPVLVQICSKIEAKEKTEAQAQANRMRQPFDPKTFKLPGLREEIIPALMGELHSTIGAAVGGRWGLPESILNGIKFLNDPTKAPEASQKLALTIAIAHKICKHLSYGLEEGLVDFYADSSLNTLGIERQEFSDLLEDLPGLVDSQLASLSS
jgi:HD-like signal output (HDOD) protein